MLRKDIGLQGGKKRLCLATVAEALTGADTIRSPAWISISAMRHRLRTRAPQLAQPKAAEGVPIARIRQKTAPSRGGTRVAKELPTKEIPMLSIKSFACALSLLMLASGCTVRAGGGARAQGGGGVAQGQQGMELLGERWVDGRSDRDSIGVAGQGRFRSITLAVDGSALEMRNVVVHFGDGSSFSPDTRLVFDGSSRSRQIDLPGDDRRITRIDFAYGNLPGGGRAHVRAFGQP